MATTAAARTMALSNYGISVGNEATFVVLNAPNAAAAVAAPPADRALIQRGELVRRGTTPIEQKLARLAS
jgi:cytosine/adenosine deaminase-related metal-dependent hydrolase